MIVYIASPYSSQEQDAWDNFYERMSRYNKVQKYIASLYSDPKSSAIMYYSPIVHFHDIAQEHGLPTDANFWWDINVTMMMAADKMEVLMLPGWQESTGVQKEIKFWEEMRKYPISFIEYK